MNWPLPQDFNEAVQNPATAFADPDLKSGQTIVGPTGLPLPRSGNFADVYQVRSANDRDWAVKCFTRPVTGLEQRYQKVDEALRKAGLPFTIGFTFLTEGVFVHGKWTPAVKMEWVDGLQLNQVVRDQAGSPKVLDALGLMWSRLCKKLRDAGIAHADLQHGNVLLVAGAKPGSYGLKLIDYDGMYVPTLANSPSGESGHPNYQHPQRAVKQVHSPDLDRFPHLVIATALRGIGVLGPKLWERYDTGDNLLFTDEDLRNPAASALLKELWQANEPSLQALVGHLAIACGKPIPQTPWLDQIAPDGVPVPLTPEQARNAAAALGVPPPASAVVVPVDASEYGVDPVAPVPVEIFELPPAEIEPGFVAREPRRTRDREVQRSPLLATAIVAGVVLVLGGAIAGGIVMFGNKKPDEVVRKEPEPKKEDDTKGKARPSIQEMPKPLEPDPVPPVKDPEPMPPPAEVSEVGKYRAGEGAKLTELWEFRGTAPILEVALAGEGKFLLAREMNSGSIRVFDARTGGRRNGYTEERASALDFASLDDGNVVSWHANRGFAAVWNPGTGRGIAKLSIGNPPAPNSPRNVRFFEVSPDGLYSVAGYAAPSGIRGPDTSDRIHIHATDGSRPLGALDVVQPILRFVSDRLLVADVNRIAWYSLPGLKLERAFKIEADASNRVLAVSRDGQLILMVDRTKEPRAFESANGKPVDGFPKRFMAAAGAISDDNRLIALCSSPEPTSPDRNSYIEVLDLKEGKVSGRFSLASNSSVDEFQLLFAPDNSYLAARRSSRHVQVIGLPRDLLAVLPKKPKEVDPVPPPPVPPPPPIPPRPVPPPKLERKPVPDEATLALAEKKLREMLKAEYARTLPTERRALAQKLLGLTDDAAVDPAAHYVLLRDCNTLAIEVLEPDLAMQALEGIIRHFAVDADQLRLASFEKIKATAAGKNNSALFKVTELAIAASDIAAANDDFVNAGKYAEVAISSAKLCESKASILEADGQLTKARRNADSFTSAKDAIERFKSNPNDLDAAYSVGRYRCFKQGKWADGLKPLAQGATDALKVAAVLETAEPGAGPDAVKLAEAWWAAAQMAADYDKRAIEYRARYWYARALPTLTGDARTQAQNRLGFQADGIEYRAGLLAEFTAPKAPSILQGKKARIDYLLAFNAGDFRANVIGAGIDLTAKWTGVLAPQLPGRYRLVFVASDPVVVRVDEKSVIPKMPRRDVVIAVSDKPIAISVEFKCKNTDQHSLKVLWSIAGSSLEESIPPEVFFHDRKTESALGKAP